MKKARIAEVKRMAELLQRRILRPPTARLGKDWLSRRLTVDADVVKVLLAERESGW